MFSQYEHFKERKAISIRRMIWDLATHAASEPEPSTDDYMRGFYDGARTDAHLAANDLLAILNKA